MDIGHQNIQDFKNQTHLSPPISHNKPIYPKKTSLTLPDSPIPERNGFQTSIPFYPNEYVQGYPSNMRDGAERLSVLQGRKKQICLKRNQTFNCTQVNIPIQNTSVSPCQSTKAKLVKKKLSIDSLNGYNRRKSRRTLSGNEESVGFDIENCQNTPNSTLPKRFRYKKNSMIETKKEYEYQRRFNRIPSVVVWHEPSINDNQIQNHESREVKQQSHSNTLQENNNNMSNCHTNEESHV